MVSMSWSPSSGRWYSLYDAEKGISETIGLHAQRISWNDAGHFTPLDGIP